MLQTFRERMQGIIAWTIVGIICFTFALWGIQSYLKGESDADAVAKVDGTKITQKQIHTAYERLKQKESAATGKYFAPDQKTQSALQKNILQQLIKDAVLTKAMDKLDFYVDRQQLNMLLTTIPIFQANGVFSPERYQHVLSNLLYTEQDFFAELKHSVILNQIQAGIVESNFILPDELANAIQLIKQKRNIGYFIISPSLFAKSAVNAAQIKDYYDKHKEEFLSPEKVSISYIKLSVSDLQNKVKVTDTDLAKFYNEHSKLYKGKALGAVKDQVKKDFTHQQAMQLLTEQNDKLTDLVYTNSDSLEPAAVALGLKVQTSELFTKNGGTAEVSKNPKVLKLAFSDTVLKQGYNSNPVELSEGNVLVLRVKEHVPESLLPLNNVQKEVETKLDAAIRHEKCQKMAGEVLNSLQQRQNPAEIARHDKLQWQTMSNVERKNDKINQKFLAAAFDLPDPQKNEKISAISVDLGTNGYAIIQALKVYPGDAVQMDSKTKQQLGNELQNDFGAYTYDLWVNGLVKKAKIKILSELNAGE